MTLAAARLAELSDLPPPAGVGVAACQNIEISKKGYAAFDAGDVEMILNYYDDNVEFVVPGNSAVSGTYRGKGGVKELFGKVAERADPTPPLRPAGCCFPRCASPPRRSARRPMDLATSRVVAG